jgi:RNA polymerase sigma factor (sigma-70 family)
MNGNAGFSCDQLEQVHELLLCHGDKLLARVRGLVQKSRPRLPSSLRNQVDHLTESVFQETCVKVIQKADQYDANQPFEVWFLYWATKELIHEVQRTQGRSKRHKREAFTEGREYEVVDHRHGNPAATALRQMEISELLALVGERLPQILNDEEVQLFYDKFLHFEDNEELARRYGKNSRSIAVQCCRIRARVAQSLAPKAPGTNDSLVSAALSVSEETGNEINHINGGIR